MRFFDESDIKSKSSILLVEHEDSKIILEAMTEYCKNNKKKVKAKKLLADMNEKWGIF